MKEDELYHAYYESMEEEYADELKQTALHLLNPRRPGRWFFDDDYYEVLRPFVRILYGLKFLMCWLAERHYNYRYDPPYPELVHIRELYSSNTDYGWSIRTVAVGQGWFRGWFIQHYEEGDSFL